MTPTEWMALGALIINVVGAAIGLTWGVGKIRDEVKGYLKEDIDELRTLIAESELTMERHTGEVGKALREKIIQVEFFIRDNYVREKDFDAMIKMIGDRFDRLQNGIDALNVKIDNAAKNNKLA